MFISIALMIVVIILYLVVVLRLWKTQPPSALVETDKISPLARAIKKTLSPLILTKEDSGRTVHVAPGQVIRWILPGNPTTGYRWRIERIDGGSVRVDDELIYTPSTPFRVGSGGSYSLHMEAGRCPGETRVVLVYSDVSGRNESTYDMTIAVDSGVDIGIVDLDSSVDLNDNQQTVNIPLCSLLQVDLPVPTEGYEWILVKMAGTSLEKTRWDGNENDTRFYAIDVGKTKLIYYYKKILEKTSVADFTVVIDVKKK